MEILGNVIDIKSAWVPANQATPQTGDYVSLKNAEGCLIVWFKAAGTAGEDQTLTLYKATDVSGTGAAVATVLDTIYYQQGATALSAVTGWTKGTQTAASTWTDATTAENEGIYCFHVRADSLGNYDCIRIDSDGAGSNAQYGGCLYILYGLRNAATPASLPNPLAD
jgi:hypothetical protein